MAKKKKKHGHYCWCCTRILPNEKFSGSGHGRHLCRECSNLGNSELQYRQALKDLDRLVTWEGIIGRKHRNAFRAFLEHPDPRIRSYAEELAAQDVKARAECIFLECRDYCESEDNMPGFEDAAVEASPEDLCSPKEMNELNDNDIPF